MESEKFGKIFKTSYCPQKNIFDYVKNGGTERPLFPAKRYKLNII